jgi:hypothetical protein
MPIDPTNPTGSESGGPSTGPSPVDSLNPTGSETPWTVEQLAAASGFYQNFIAQHGIQGWGTVDDPLRVYKQLRASGTSHDEALNAALHTLGWDDQSQWPTQGTPNPAPNSGGGPTGGTPAPTGTPAPQFTPPPVKTPAPFNYADFVAPDPNNLNNDPDYVFNLRREQDAIQHSAAASGMLNTGGTMDALMRNASDIAKTGYANLYNRSLSTYQTNRGNALDTYNTNYGTQYQDPYKYQYQGAQDAYNSQQHNYDLSKQYGWYQTLFDWQKQNDRFNQKYNLLGLG